MNNTAENLIVQPEGYTSELGELNRVEAALAELKAKHGNVPDYATQEGYAAGKAAIKELTSYRTGTDKARLAITKPHREFIEQVNTYGKALIAEIEQLEKPHRDAKQAVDEAEQRKKEERIAKLRERLEKEVTSYLDTAVGLDSAGLADLITAAEGIDTAGYFDITKEAEDEAARVVRELRALHDQALQREQFMQRERELAAERAELERQKAELEALKAQAAQAQAPAPSPADPLTEEEAKATPFDQGEEADPYGDALEDLQGLGLDPSQAVAVLSAIQAGQVRYITASLDLTH